MVKGCVLLKNWVIRSFLFLFLVCQGWFIYTILHQPYLNFSVTESNGNWIVSEIDERSLINKTNLEIGDIILQIDGNQVSDLESVRRWGTVDQAKSIIIKKNNVLFTIDTTSLNELTSQDLSSLCGGIFCFVICYFIFFGIKKSQSSKCLSLVFLNIGLTFMSLGASIRGDLAGKIVIGTSLAMIPATLLHFLIVFLKEKGNITLNYSFMRFVYIFIFITVLPQFSYFSNWKYNRVVHDFTANFELTLFSCGIACNILLLAGVFIKFRKMNSYVSIMLKTIGIFFAVSTLPIVCLTFLSKILFGFEYINSNYTSWIVLLFPLSFTYLLATKKIYDIDLVVRRFILTTTLSIIPSFIVVAITYVISSGKEKVTYFVLALMFTILLFSITLYSVEYLSTRLEKILFPRRHFLQKSLNNISSKLGLISSYRELKSLVLVDIVDVLQIFGGAIVFKYSGNDDMEIISEGNISVEKIKNKINRVDEAIDDLYCFELTRNEQYFSVLVLSGKKSNTHFGSEELHWLSLVTSYLSVSMENLYLIRQLSLKLEKLAMQIPDGHSVQEIAWFRKLMFELQEKERYRIATDLHDTTMQDLFFLKRKLSMLTDNIHSQDPPSLQGILDYIDIINMNLRQSCFELHPYMLNELGLIVTIEKLMHLERNGHNFELEFSYNNPEVIEKCNMEMKRHIFRVIQELINNAKKHSNASFISIKLSVKKEMLHLMYRDNGVGLYTNTISLDSENSKMGLEQLKSRILSLNGYSKIYSEKDKGFYFAASIPLSEGMTA